MNAYELILKKLQNITSFITAGKDISRIKKSASKLRTLDVSKDLYEFGVNLDEDDGEISVFLKDVEGLRVHLKIKPSLGSMPTAELYNEDTSAAKTLDFDDLLDIDNKLALEVIDRLEEIVLNVENEDNVVEHLKRGTRANSQRNQ